MPPPSLLPFPDQCSGFFIFFSHFLLFFFHFPCFRRLISLHTLSCSFTLYILFLDFFLILPSPLLLLLWMLLCDMSPPLEVPSLPEYNLGSSLLGSPLSCVILLSSWALSLQGSPLSLTSLIFMQILLVLHWLSSEVRQEALCYLRSLLVFWHGGYTSRGSAERTVKVRTKRCLHLVGRMKAANSLVCVGQPISV